MLGFHLPIFFCIQYSMLADIQGENESKPLKHLEW